jgi:methyl-accepting chemotaxis protein
MDLDSAISAHEQWVFKFKSAISTASTLDAATIAKDNCCEFGKWLYGEGQSMHGHRARFSVIIGKHAEFHKLAGKVAEAVNAKQYKEAQDMIDYASTAFGQATQGVKVAILGLKGEIGA